MRLAISNIAWPNEEEATIARRLPDIGVSGIDIAFTKLWPSPADATEHALHSYRAFWHSRSLEIVGMQSLLFGRPDLLLFSDDATRLAMHAYLHDVFRLARQLGARPLVFGSPGNRANPGLPPGEALAIATDFFTALADAATTENVILCIEPNPAEYGCNFIRTASKAVELLERVNRPGFRLHLDSAIMTMNGEEIDATLDRAAPWLAHFHVSEPQLGLIGSGQVDHPRFARALRRIGYQGWLSIEMRSGLRSPNLAAVERSVASTRAAYNL